ncbi:hypothetical protein R84B8_00379 [Treponema sp. R8-4-B8]
MFLKRQNWINIAKLIAIVAVIIDHTNGLLYTDRHISLFSYYSVSLFVLLSGITSFYSNRRHYNERGIKETIRRVNNLLVPYAIATALYQTYYNRGFDLRTYVSQLLSFSASPPFYFILFFLQLLIISPFLYDIIVYFNKKNYPLIWHIIFVFIGGVVSIFSLKYTFMLPVHGGGKYIFGATYIVLYYIGMWFASNNFKIISKTVHVWFTGLSIILLIAWYLFIYQNKFTIDSKLPFGNGFNPPSVSLGVYGLLMGLFLFLAITLIERLNNGVLQWVIRILVKMGNYSLYIFLYHLLVRNIILQHTLINNIWAKRLIIFPAMLFVPCVIKGIFDLCVQVYKNKIKIVVTG